MEYLPAMHADFHAPVDDCLQEASSAGDNHSFKFSRDRPGYESAYALILPSYFAAVLTNSLDFNQGKSGHASSLCKR